MNTETLPQARHANLHFVTPRLAVGGDVSAYDSDLALRQLAEIDALGITHVVDARLEWSDEELFAAGTPHIAYLHHGMDDAGQVVPDSWFEEAVTWVEAAWEPDPQAVVLTHCHMGINRGPSLGFAVLLSQGWHPVDAIARLRAVRPQANCWYAGDALRWHHRRTGADTVTRLSELAALQAWRDTHPLDVARVIRQARAEGR